MTSIPGTGYQISGNNFIDPNGNQLSQQQFVDKVKSKEISLTEGSLKFLEGQPLGTDTLKSLKQSMPSTPQSVSANLAATDQNLSEVMDLFKVIHQFGQEQRKSTSDIRQSQGKGVLDGMQKSADEMMGAARARFAGGLVGGVMTVGSGAISVFSAIGTIKPEFAFKSGFDDKANLKFGEGLSAGLDGLKQITTASIELGAAGHDKNAKDSDIATERLKQQKEKTEELANDMRELESKAREALQAVVQSTREMQRI